MWESWFGGASTPLMDTTSVAGMGADSFSSGAFGNNFASGLSDSTSQLFDTTSIPGMGADGFSTGIYGNEFSNSAAMVPETPGFLNSFGDKASSIFGNINDIAGSNAFKNLTGLGISLAQYNQTKKQLEKSNAIQDEQQAGWREDRAYNKERRNRTSALRF